MTTKVTYEWALHEVDEHGDIVDHNFGESLEWFLQQEDTREQLRQALHGSQTWQLELWRDRGNDVDGLLCRGYGYYDADTGLAKAFDLTASGDRESGGPKVPAKFFKQIEAAKRALGIE